MLTGPEQKPTNCYVPNCHLQYHQLLKILMLQTRRSCLPSTVRPHFETLPAKVHSIAGTIPYFLRQIPAFRLIKAWPWRLRKHWCHSYPVPRGNEGAEGGTSPQGCGDQWKCREMPRGRVSGEQSWKATGSKENTCAPADEIATVPWKMTGGWAVVFDTEEQADRPAKFGVDRGATDPRLWWASEIVPGVERYLEAGKWRQQTFARGSAGTSYRKKLDLWNACTKKKERHLFRLPFPILLLIAVLD